MHINETRSPIQNMLRRTHCGILDGEAKSIVLFAFSPLPGIKKALDGKSTCSISSIDVSSTKVYKYSSGEEKLTACIHIEVFFLQNSEIIILLASHGPWLRSPRRQTTRQMPAHIVECQKNDVTGYASKSPTCCHVR